MNNKIDVTCELKLNASQIEDWVNTIEVRPNC